MASKISPEEFSKLVRGQDKIKRPAGDFKSIPVLPVPKGIEPLDPDDPSCNVFIARSVFHMAQHSIWIPITMTIVCESSGDVTLVNSFRVPANVEDDIVALGRIRRVVKLGQFHGAAGDAYWVREPRFQSPDYWAPPGATVAPGLAVTHKLEVEAEPPIEGATVSTLATIPFPEYVMIVPIHNNRRLLVTCDSLMHIFSADEVPVEGHQILHDSGYICTEGTPQPTRNWTGAVIGFCGKEALLNWVKEICDKEWCCFVSAHGSPVVDCDHSKILEATDTLLSSSSVQTLVDMIQSALSGKSSV